MILDMVRCQVLIFRFEIKFFEGVFEYKIILINGVISLVMSVGRKILNPHEEY